MEKPVAVMLMTFNLVAQTPHKHSVSKKAITLCFFPLHSLQVSPL